MLSQKKKVCELTDLTFAEMFSGIGGFRLGLEKNGWKCVWANDIDKYANTIYKKKFGCGELVEGDVRQISEETIPEHTLLTAGFPCQSFSLAGKRQGFKDIRGTLFYEVARVAKTKKPKLLLLENVKGLLSAQDGYCFFRILEILDELGYDVEWQVLNSKDFGVPQNRERVFIVGHFRTEPSRQIFPIREGCGLPLQKNSGLPLQKNRSEQETEEGIWSSDISPTIDARYGALRNAGEPCIAQTLEATYHKQKSFVNMISENLIHCHWRRTGNPEDGGTGPLFSNETVFALDRTPHHVINKSSIRRLTPTECERLQGFPDGWTEGVSDTQRYKLLGNAVTVNVIEFLGKQLLGDAFLEYGSDKK